MTSDFLQELEEQLTVLLTESRGVAARKVNDAINNQYRVQIQYNDNLHKRKKGQKYKRTKAPTGMRLIEPYVLGISKAGNKVLRAFQYSGATRRGVPKWKMFRLDRIINWNPLPKSKFYVDPAQMDKLVPDYNTEGDKSMVSVLNQVHMEKPELERSTNEREDGQWESPLDRIRRQMGINKSNVEKQKTIMPPESDDNNANPVKTSGLNNALTKQKENSFVDDLDSRLGVSADKYAKDAMSPQQKHDRNINKRRDDRWQNAADTRPLWRKGSANDDLLNMDTYFSKEPDLDDKYGEEYYDDTYDDMYEPDNYKRR